MDSLTFSKAMKVLRENKLTEFSFTHDLTKPQLISFIKALECNSSVKTVYFFHTNIEIEEAKKIEELLKINVFIKKICFSATQMSKASIAIISQGLENNKSLIEFHFFNQETLDDQTTAAIIHPIKLHPTLKIFNLFNAVFAERAVQSLRNAIKNTQLSTLYFYNVLGIEKLAPALKEAKVKELYLCNSMIDDEAMEKICQALKTNQTLESLYLFMNNLTSLGFISILEMLKENDKLTCIEFSGNLPKKNYDSEIKIALEQNFQKKQSQRRQKFFLFPSNKKNSHKDLQISGSLYRNCQ